MPTLLQLLGIYLKLMQGFAEPLHYKHATLDTLCFQHNAKILQTL